MYPPASRTLYTNNTKNNANLIFAINLSQVANRTTALFFTTHNNAESTNPTNTGYTQQNGAVSMVNKGKPHHSFVYTLYIYLKLPYGWHQEESADCILLFHESHSQDEENFAVQ
jgi:hypothetical protein